MRQSFSPPVLETRSAEPAVALREVTKMYGSGGGAVTALHEVTADFAPGSFTAVMGPSGSGKSTLLQCAAGLDRPSSGEVRLAGQSLRGLSETKLTRLRRDQIGFVFQSFNLLPSLTAELNVALPLRLAGRKPAKGEVRDMLAVVGLADRARHRPSELSGGQQQRVAIARALVTKPSVVFADEPTGARCSACSASWPTPGRRLSWSPTTRWPPPTPTGWCSWPTAGSPVNCTIPPRSRSPPE